MSRFRRTGALLTAGALAFFCLPLHASDEPYRVGPKDLLRFNVSEVPSLNVEARVDPNGRVTLPLMGDLAVDGLTTAEIAGHLGELLESRYVQKATVTVRVEEYLSRSVNLVGAVTRPGPVGMAGPLNLLDAIFAAGSLRQDHGQTIEILRRAPNGVSARLDIPVEALIDEADPHANIPLAPNDVVRIPVAASVTIYLLGEVASPGPITFESGERATLLAAIARAGGLSDRASNKIRIKRNRAEPNSPGAILDVDYKQLVNAKVADVELGAGDVIVIKESFF
jgi:polysaccharide biosynthesis/export protein